ncbi:MAG: hypothetical protein OXC62_11310 [Aestuariivita sp.]|nr:hypothetical protein [Aestuariivita sp.]
MSGSKYGNEWRRMIRYWAGAELRRPSCRAKPATLPKEGNNGYQKSNG